MDTERNRVIGEVLRRLRKRSGLTQEEVAERLMRNQCMVCKMEKGDRALPFIETWLYAEALGTDAVILIQESYEALVDAGMDPQIPSPPRKRWDEE